ncbi:sulfatase-like hydrolase/transferase [Lentisphaerota bacterium WC36G]|nr:sulfatase-like hydrolase/transferase [Lentisphaerae bacterium WC36]
MKTRPNIIFILSDDQGHWAMNCAGNNELITPNLNNLAATGILFDNFFCTSPVCSPARASILTGKIPSQHGVHDWIRKGNIKDINGDYGYQGKDRPIDYLANLALYTEILADNGYNCGLSGKWHLGDSGRPRFGHRYWYSHAFGGSSYYNYQVFENGELKTKTKYLTEEFTDKALDFLDMQKGCEEPFYLGVHYTAPHSPWEKEEHPAEIWALYDDCEFNSVPNLPPHPWDNGMIYAFTPKKRRETLQGYFTAITAMDKQIGRIIDKLEEMNIREETIIIFTADNGMNMGHHGIFGKGNGTFPMNMYDSAIKVPFIISAPSKVEQGVINSNMHSHYDIFPTLIDYLQLEVAETNNRFDTDVIVDLPGKSFAGVLNGKDYGSNGHVVIFDEYGPVRMIRTQKYKYVHRYPYGPHEFYNLEKDPSEDINLIYNEDYINEINNMRRDLVEWFKKWVNHECDGANLAVTGSGQVDVVTSENGGRLAFCQNYVQKHDLNISQDDFKKLHSQSLDQYKLDGNS